MIHDLVARVRALRANVTRPILQDVAKLALGTLTGRLIAVAAMPALTRLYTPDDFATLAVYMAVVGTIVSAACLRLEIAVPMAEDDQPAAALLALSLLALIATSGGLTAAVLFAPELIVHVVGHNDIRPWLWLIPVGVFVGGSYSATQYWSTRSRRFNDIARTRVTQAAVGVATMIGLGLAGSAPLGLLLGNTLSSGAGGVGLAFRAWRHEAAALRAVRWPHMASALIQYRRFPLLSTPEALLNVASGQLPVILIAAYAGSEAGFLLVAMQLMTAPLTLLGSAISQVYLSRAPEQFRSGNLTHFTINILRKLLIVGTGPIILVGALGRVVFPLVLGQEWERSGEIVTLMIPWMILQFAASPLSTAMLVVDRQRALLGLTLFGLVIRTASVVLAVGMQEMGPVEGFIVGSAIYYAAVLLFTMKAAGISSSEARTLMMAWLDWRVLIPLALAAGFLIL